MNGLDTRNIKEKKIGGGGMNYKLQLKCRHVQIEAVGDRDFVETKFKDLENAAIKILALEAKIPSASSQPTASTIKEIMPVAPAVPKAPKRETNLTKFIDEKKLSSNTHIALAVIYYHTKMLNTIELPMKPIKESCAEVQDPPIKNLSVALQYNIKKGFIEKNKFEKGAALYRLTDDGARFVEGGFKK